MGDSSLVILAVVGIIAVIIGVFVVAHMMEKKRTAALQEQAARLSIDFHPTDALGLQARFGSFHLFGQGHGKKLKNVLSSTNEGVEIHVFDYKYTVGYGKHSHTYNQTIVAVSDPELNLPKCTVGPKSFFAKIGTIFGYQDINFDEYPVFSKKFLLRGDNEEEIRQAFNKDVIKFYEDNIGMSTEAQGNTLIVYRGSKRQKPEEISELLETGKAVADFFYGVE